MSLRLTQSDEELRERFYTMETGEDVADLLDVPYPHLIWHLYRSPEDKRYTTFEIAKASGGVRTICAPATAIKLIQQKLNQVLQAVYERKPCVYGFIRGRSIVSNARKHRRKRFVLNVDLADFFPSINFGRVRGVFMAPPYNRNARVATVLAQICCHKNHLPQGAPTSPVVSNIICAKMDSELQRLARDVRCYYTRYADDLTFSTSEREFPHELAVAHSRYVTEVGEELKRVIVDNGFQINPRKVRLATRYVRQEVTGLTVNERVNVSRKLIREVRAMLHSWETNGPATAESDYYRKGNARHRHPDLVAPALRNIIWGKLEFIGMVRGKHDKTYLKYLKQFNKLDRKWR